MTGPSRDDAVLRSESNVDTSDQLIQPRPDLRSALAFMLFCVVLLIALTVWR
ncbi:hypothetical protein [Gordonia soli]|uniref:Uncharacterized protein n=1 Tax=Gordonia soli NBRC 108243 TaxID=1223545 RepID=M0QRA5_9ACTN|nr:hypothetical protein [Gordonia soli]GAC70954.1 hypothetical protein GS4_45_00100 [Gordonia soli NBRC 108243]